MLWTIRVWIFLWGTPKCQKSSTLDSMHPLKKALTSTTDNQDPAATGAADTGGSLGNIPRRKLDEPPPTSTIVSANIIKIPTRTHGYRTSHLISCKPQHLRSCNGQGTVALQNYRPVFTTHQFVDSLNRTPENCTMSSNRPIHLPVDMGTQFAIRAQPPRNRIRYKLVGTP